MNTRIYVSPRRAEDAARTRARIVKAAATTLAAGRTMSLDAVAKKARVTRLTVYNQFGSRRALLEAVFDDLAARGGLHRIHGVMASADAYAALRQIVAIFCDFWSGTPGALVRLQGAATADAEFAASLRARNERRRQLLTVLVERMGEGRPRRPGAVAEVVDTLFALTSFAFFSELTSNGRSASAACRLIQRLVMDVVGRAMAQGA
jgi:AcrR family transcriptional regulator